MKNKIQGKEKIKTESTVNDLDIKDEDEGSNSGGTSAVGPLVCTERVSRYMEGKFDGRIGSRGDGV